MSSKAKTTGTKEDGKPALVPKLRFPEFQGAEGWPQSELGQNVTILKGKGIAKADLDPSGAQPCIRYGELYTRYGETISQTVSRTNVPVSELFLSKPDDVIIPSSGETKIDIAKASCVLAGGIALGGDLNVIRSKLNGTFLSYYLNGPKRFEIAKVAQGDTVVHLYPHQLEALQIALPSPAEQQKIAECLSSVDELMAAQARKVDALKTHKKGLMQQLFPREGETQPRLRFPEFQNAGEWVPDTLENLCTAKISYGIVQAGPHVPNGMPYIKSTDLNSALCLDQLERTSDIIAKKYQRSEVVPGDLVFSLRGNIGVSQIVPKEIPVANLTQGTARIRTKGPSQFFLHALWSQPVHSRILAVSKGSTFQEISLEHLRQIQVFHPDEAEQQRIAACLSSLDARITAEAQKLEALKLHKRGLMQQLFPSPEPAS